MVKIKIKLLQSVIKMLLFCNQQQRLEPCQISIFPNLKSIIEINSWTKNKEGVDKNGEIFAYWLEALGIYP